MAPGRPVQVVTVINDADHGPMFELQEDALREVLLQDDIKDLPVAVISVAGKMRQGKSFFLNFVIQYLKNKLRGTDDYALLDGFEWRCGPDSCTSGILVWSEVFVVEVPNGKKVAVLLMDTQGTFDINTTMKECSTLFALSTMLSSVQIYNVMNDIKRDDLDSLQLFVEYAKTAQKQGHNARPFKGLLFLVRDWAWLDHHPLGAGGGEDFINKKLQNKEDVRGCFEKVSCYLLPYPWEKLERDREALVKFSGISDNFKELVRKLLTDMLDWNKLNSMVKELDGEQVRVKDILKYFKAYLMIFEGNKMPTPKSAFDANVLVSTTKAYENSLNTFEDLRKTLDISVENSVSQESEMLYNSLKVCQELAVENFESSATFGGNVKVMDQYLAKLYQDTDAIIESLVDLNNIKREKEEAEEMILKAEYEKTDAERKQNEANIKEEQALKTLQQLTHEKETAEKNKIIAEAKLSELERRNDKLCEELKEVVRSKNQLMEEANRQVQEANEAKEAATKMRDEAERKRKSAVEKMKESGNTDTALKKTARVICDVVSAASSFLPGHFRLVGLTMPPIRRWFE